MVNLALHRHEGAEDTNETQQPILLRDLIPSEEQSSLGQGHGIWNLSTGFNPAYAM